LEYCTNEGLGS